MFVQHPKDSPEKKGKAQIFVMLLHDKNGTKLERKNKFDTRFFIRNWFIRKQYSTVQKVTKVQYWIFEA